MGLHIYCVVPASHAPPPGLKGIDGAAVDAVAAEALAVWVSTHPEPPPASADAAAVHNRVVAAGMTTRVTPVPVRFGQWLQDEAEAADRLGGDAHRWQALLARFAGRAEYGVRVVDTQMKQEERDVRPSERTGRAYMAALAQRHARHAERKRRAEAISSEIIDAVGALASERSVELGATGASLFSLAFLVAWEHADAYHSAIRRLQKNRCELAYLHSGPWPPYSFAG